MAVVPAALGKFSSLGMNTARGLPASSDSVGSGQKMATGGRESPSLPGNGGGERRNRFGLHESE